MERKETTYDNQIKISILKMISGFIVNKLHHESIVNDDIFPERILMMKKAKTIASPSANLNYTPLPPHIDNPTLIHPLTCPRCGKSRSRDYDPRT